MCISLFSHSSWATSSNYSSYSSNSNSSSGLGVGRKTSYGGNLRDTSFEENEEYEYEENQGWVHQSVTFVYLA